MSRRCNSPLFLVCRSMIAFGVGAALIAGILVGQEAPAAAVSLYDSINGSTAGGSDGANNGTWLANQFNTDASIYSLDSVTLSFSGSPSGSIAVDVYDDASTEPGTLLGTLLNPGSWSSGSNTFTPAGGFPSLAASSSFWVVLRGDGVGAANWSYTGDAPSGPGTSTNTNFSSNSGTTWPGLSSGTPYMMIVNASSSAAVPEIDPNSFGSALSLVLGSLVLLEQRRRGGLKTAVA